MVIRILDHIQQCYTNDDGDVIFQIINQAMVGGADRVQLSFDGVESIPTSFVNSAFIPLLDTFSFDAIKKRLTFVDSTRQINQMIRDRFTFEAQKVNGLLSNTQHAS